MTRKPVQAPAMGFSEESVADPFDPALFQQEAMHFRQQNPRPQMLFADLLRYLRLPSPYVPGLFEGAQMMPGQDAAPIQRLQ